ncbi:LysR family transcriptional regulator [Legionella sainthelensi]|uniref:LysR family transcriptional regulator n=1 Tax=Legionella sainthelensi TaxID=28087 RepID=UPI001F5458CD|nr:LysR family transcriptional regulator [Legionella sainthelensi]
MAAQKLHITQSAISKRIRKIEDELGVRLLIMEGSKLTLSKAAKLLVPYARQIVSAHQNMIQSLKESKKFSQDVVIGASAYVSHHVFPNLLKYLHQDSPIIQPHIKTISEYELEFVLNQGIVDLVICHARDVSEKLCTVFLWEEKFNLVVASDHELAKVSTLSLSYLSKYPAILTERGATIRDKIDLLFKENHLSLKVNFEISTIDAIKPLVEYGLGWSYLPKNLISEKLKILRINDVEITVPFYLFYPQKRNNDQLVIDLLGYFAKWKNRDGNENKILSDPM